MTQSSTTTDRTEQQQPDPDQESWWSHGPDEVASTLDVEVRTGLTAAEVEQRLERYGPNDTAQAEGPSYWQIAWDQFLSPIVGILVLAGVAALLAGEIVEAVAVLIAVLINAVIGFVTEIRALQSVESLREIGRTTAIVRRDDTAGSVDAAKLVPGDVVMLEEGDVVPADLRLVEVANLQIDEAPLTGESVPQQKDTAAVEAETPLAERSSMAYKGTAVTSGSGVGVVAETGPRTQIGQISTLVEDAGEDGKTPLEARLDDLAKALIVAVIVIGIVVAALGIAVGQDVQEMIEVAIALAVAAVPEGLAVVATLALARGVVRMSRRNALVKRLASVETLGSAGVVFTDKTGTLTEGRMQATVLLLSDDRRVDLADVDVDADEAAALTVGSLCGNATMNSDDDPEDGEDVGDPMELALQRAAVEAGIGDREDLVDRLPELREVAFDRDTKMMATFHRLGDGDLQGVPADHGGEVLVAVKGAPDAVVGACTTEMGGGDLTDGDRERWVQRQEDLAAQGLRVLGLARKITDDEGVQPYENLELIGMVGLLDPPREGTAEAIERCHRAGVEVVMVTGDQPATATAIARDIGLADGEIHAMRGADVPPAAEWDDDMRERLASTAVFARLDPEQKLDLIALAQARGNVVGMTGDGVNDAPALTKADIGIAMGQKGTQVARDSSDIILQDDAFATIVHAIREGRTIFENIRRFVVYLLSGNLGEILAVTAAAVSGAALPLLPLQILYINLVSDVFPAAALGVVKGDDSVLNRPPRDPEEPIMDRSRWVVTTLWAVLIGGVTLGVFALAHGPLDLSDEQAVTVSFLTFVIARLVHVFNMRAPDEPIAGHPILKSKAVWAALGVSGALAVLAVVIPPLASVLGLVTPTASMLGLSFGGGLVVLVVGQLAISVQGRRIG
ncbi:cation-translocating P-type ATPase [Euzebya tangerina]|uniref:cation-translocating P-type ATPase n=1 Tax=Euzebya tangerina TaxID=591198 RepID=UPI000E31D6A5|nr:cation-transporting P-type ATPase [Euzebya tangerina]